MKSMNLQDVTNSLNEKTLLKSDIQVLNLPKKIENKDMILSLKCLDLKGITAFFTHVQSEIIEKRSVHGVFIDKRKSTENKRFCFLISQKPLNLSEFSKDDYVLDEKIIPNFLNFDSLTLFTCENDQDTSPPIERFDMKNCLDIVKIDSETDYHIKLDFVEISLSLICKSLGQRDHWIEALKISNQTAMLKKSSITKKPANLAPFIKYIELNGNDKIFNYLEIQRNRIYGDFKITEKDDLIKLTHLKNEILYPILDASLLLGQPNIEIIKNYLIFYNKDFMKRFALFWESNYLSLNTSDLIDFSVLIFKNFEELKKFKIKDFYLSTNGTKIIKDYFSRVFKNMRENLLKILKSEREIKAVKNKENILITNAPNQIFNLFYENLEEFSKLNIKYFFEYGLKIYKEILLNYLLALDELIKREDYFLSRELLIAIANNSPYISTLINDFIFDLSEYKIIDPNEIEQRIGLKELLLNLNIITTNSINRLVSIIYKISFKSVENFYELDIQKVSNLILEDFSKFKAFLHPIIKKKIISNLMKTCIYEYIELMIGNEDSHDSLEKLLSKIKNDKNIFLETFEELLGKTIIKDKTRIIELLISIATDDHEIVIDNIEVISKFQDFDFNSKFLELLINLRIDISEEERKVLVQKCFDIFGNKNLLSNDINNNSDSKHDNTEKKVESFIQRKTINLHEFLELPGKKEFNNLGKATKRKSLMNYFNEVIKFSSKLEKCDRNKIWKIRHFVLKDRILYWFSNESSINFNNFLMIDDIDNIVRSNELEFIISCKDTFLSLKADNKKLRDDWINVLEEEMNEYSIDKKLFVYENNDLSLKINKTSKFQTLYQDKNYIVEKNSLEIDKEISIETSLILKKPTPFIFDKSQITSEIVQLKKKSMIDPNQSFFVKNLIDSDTIIMNNKREEILKVKESYISENDTSYTFIGQNEGNKNESLLNNQIKQPPRGCLQALCSCFYRKK